MRVKSTYCSKIRLINKRWLTTGVDLKRKFFLLILRRKREREVIFSTISSRHELNSCECIKFPMPLSTLFHETCLPGSPELTGIPHAPGRCEKLLTQ